MKKIVAFVIAFIVVFIIACPMLSAKANSPEYRVWSLKPEKMNEKSVCVPVYFNLIRPGSIHWECTVVITGPGYFRTKTFDVFFGGSKGVVFSNSDIGKNGEKVPQLIPGNKYYSYCLWNRKGNASFEFVEQNLKEFVIPFPKIKFENVKAVKHADGKYYLSGEIKNLSNRGRVDWWFEIVSDHNSCNITICGQNMLMAEDKIESFSVETGFNIAGREADFRHRFQIRGWDYSRNEMIESSWYIFNDQDQ